MTSPKFCRNSGLIITDVILATVLSMIFVAIVTESTLSAREIFEKTKAKEQSLRTYLSGEASTTVRMYGNERLQTDYVAGMDRASVSFMAVEVDRRGNNNFNYFETAGTPLCSVDFMRRGTAVAKELDLPLDPALPLTDLTVRDGIAYLTADSSTASDPDLVIIDFHDRDHVIERSALNTGPGLRGLTLAGHYIYAVAPSTVAELHIIHLADPDHPSVEKKFRLPLPYATATPALGSSIYYHSGKVFLGTEKWDGDEFKIIDVSDPTQPSVTAGVEVGSKVGAIYVTDGKAYLGTAAQQQLLGFDLADIRAPQIFGSLSPSGWQRQEGNRIDFFENSLQFGRTSGGYDIPLEHELFTAPDASRVFETAPKSINVPGGIYGLVSDREHIFLASKMTGRELTIIDRNLNASSTISLSLPIEPQALTCDGDSLYLLAHNSPTIYEITFR